MNKKWLKYLFRIAIILIFDSLIRGFDLTFNGIFNFSTRAVFFFISFFLFWMIIWKISSSFIQFIYRRLHGKLKSIQLFVTQSGIIVLLATGAAILFNFFYRFYDVHLFGMSESWAQVPFPHTDLIYPLILVTVIIYAFDTYINYLIRMEDIELRMVNLERDNILTSYQALKNQVDPHFFFNSLSVLSSIIHTDPETSVKYIHDLSKLYRNKLETTYNNVIPLSDELVFLDSYIFLMKIRYPDSLDFRIEIDRSKSDKTGIHPNSLQLLIENAIKHNTFTQTAPLVIEISENDEYIFVRNRIRKKNQTMPSTGIGLENIRKRYELDNKKKTVVQVVDDYFIVKLPKIEIALNEDRNR